MSISPRNALSFTQSSDIHPSTDETLSQSLSISPPPPLTVVPPSSGESMLFSFFAETTSRDKTVHSLSSPRMVCLPLGICKPAAVH